MGRGTGRLKGDSELPPPTDKEQRLFSTCPPATSSPSGLPCWFRCPLRTFSAVDKGLCVSLCLSPWVGSKLSFAGKPCCLLGNHCALRARHGGQHFHAESMNSFNSHSNLTPVYKAGHGTAEKLNTCLSYIA